MDSAGAGTGDESDRGQQSRGASSSSVAVGDLVELDVTNIAHGGASIARLDGRVVFVADAIPGERVLASVTDASDRSFWRATTVSTVATSPFRREHVWAAAGLGRAPDDRAGGAEFGHIALEHQRELKRQVLADALARMAGIQSDVVVEPVASDAAGNGLGWRTRVRLHVDATGRVGPFAARSHRVIEVRDLPLAVSGIEAEFQRGGAAGARSAPERRAGGRGRRRDADHVDLLESSSDGAIRILPSSDRTGAAREEVTEVVGDRRFQLDAGGFWQVHRGAALALSRAVRDAIDPALFDPDAANLDLYGGVGLLAAAMADRAAGGIRVTTVESDPRATTHASANLADIVGAEAETGRVEQWMTRLAASASGTERSRLARATVVLDPPRAGAGRAVIQAMTDVAPAQIVYVACDPVAFARDAGLLATAGYGLQRLRAFDLFPHTHHVEAVGTFTRS